MDASHDFFTSSVYTRVKKIHAPPPSFGCQELQEIVDCLVALCLEGVVSVYAQ